MTKDDGSLSQKSILDGNLHEDILSLTDQKGLDFIKIAQEENGYGICFWMDLASETVLK